MKLPIQATILLAMTGLAQGQSTPEAVNLYLVERGGSTQLRPGIPLASHMFAKIGVRLKWHWAELPAVRSARLDGSFPVVFGIRMVERAPQSATSRALASAHLVGSSAAEITVYSDRLGQFLADHPTLRDAAASYVLTHELAHVMQGVARHSDTGILKAEWSKLDYQDMVYHKLVFTPFDIESIHQGLALQRAKVR